MRHFQAKISKIPTPTGEGNTPDQTLTLGIYLCTYFFCFFGHCTYESSHGKALIWSGKVMEIDVSKVVGTMVLIAVLFVIFLFSFCYVQYRMK